MKPMSQNEVNAAGAVLSNVLGEWRCVLPRGEVITDPDKILHFIYKRFLRSKGFHEQRAAARSGQ